MLDELERLHQAATPGPWYGMNADFIAAALPALLAVARAAQALLDQVPSTIDDLELDEAREALEAALAALDGAEGREGRDATFEQ